MKIKKEMIVRDIAGDTVLIPLGDSLRDNNGLFMLTETGRFIWDILPECDSSEEIARKLTDEYEVSFDEAKTDVEEFLDRLRSFDIID